MKSVYSGKFINYFIKDRKLFYKYFGLSFVVGILELFGVALTYPFIIGIISDDGINTKSLLYGILIISAFLIKNGFMIFYNALQADFTKTCEANINKTFMNYFLYGSYNNITQIPFAKKIQIIGFLTPCVINNYLVRMLNLMVNSFIFVLIIGFLFAKFFIATTVTLTCALLILFIQANFFKNKTSIISQEINQANEKLNESINEPLLNIKSVKIFNAETMFFNKYSEKLEKFKNLARDLLFYNSIPAYITEPFVIILLLILLAIISIQNASNTTTLVASYAVIVSAIFRLAPTVSRIQVNLTGINTSIPQVKELIGYYEDFKLDKFTPEETKLIEFNNEIELKNISFNYSDKEILKNINLQIQKGQFIGIAGTSGAGKTTLIDIIAGLLDFNNGEIYIDKKIYNNKTSKLKIGYIPQDFCIISGSIRENVAFGTGEINDEKVITALKQAQLYDFIVDSYPDGIYAEPFIDTYGISQGQKQRLAIARALYKDPDIIILDEATSSLDLRTEEDLCDVLNKLKGEKTILAIAHRISTLKNADVIYMLQDSTIASKGSFNELYRNNSEFKKLVDLNNTNSIN